MLRRLFFIPLSFVILLGVFLILPIVINTTVYAAVVLNEVYPKPSDEVSEWIELYNTGPDSVTLDGWRLENTNGEKKTFSITGTTMPAGNFLRLDQSQTGIKLSNEGDSVRLYDGGGNQVDIQGFPSILGYNMSVGRSPDGTGLWTFCDLATPNLPNNCPPPTLPPTPIPTVTPVPTATPIPTATPLPTNSPTPVAPVTTAVQEVKGVTYEATPLPGTVSSPQPGDFTQSEEYKRFFMPGLFAGIVLAIILFTAGLIKMSKKK